MAVPAVAVAAALRMAVQHRTPSPGLLLHSDRGSHYASGDYQAWLGQQGIRCRMSRTGNGWDNAVMERFFLTLKQERVGQNEYANPAEAERDVTQYIVAFTTPCACTRPWAIGHLPPLNRKQ